MDGAGSQRRVRYWLIGNTLTPTYCEIVDVKQSGKMNYCTDVSLKRAELSAVFMVSSKCPY